jgi:hypothetical protein
MFERRRRRNEIECDDFRGRRHRSHPSHDVGDRVDGSGRCGDQRAE